MQLNFVSMSKYQPMFIEGVRLTVLLSIVGVIIGILLGAFLGLIKTIDRNKMHGLSKIIASVADFMCTAYIEIIRGTPVMVQIMIVFFIIPEVFHFDISRFWSGAIALGLNSAAYVAEIVRSGIQAVDKGQMEAARSLGMNAAMAMMRIVMPQAVRNVLPALGNEFIVVIKESSVVSVVGVGELMMKVSAIRGASYRAIEPLLIASALYFILTFTLSKLVGIGEHRLSKSERARQPVRSSS